MLLCVLIGLFNIFLRHRGDAYPSVYVHWTSHATLRHVMPFICKSDYYSDLHSTFEAENQFINR